MGQDTPPLRTGFDHKLYAIKADDHHTLKALYQENYPKVEKFVLANSGSIDEAKDIYQDAFLAFWRNIQLDRFVPRNETALEGYLFTIARNKWMDQLRSGRFKLTVAYEDDHGEQADEPGVSEEENAYLVAVREHFGRLGSQCQDVLTRFYFNKQNMSTIAAAFDWTEQTARNSKYRCLQKLKEFLKHK